MSTSPSRITHLQPQSLRHYSSTHRLSTSTANPLTPSPSPTNPAIDIHSARSNDDEPTLHRVGSMERTRTWAEEVARQRKLDKQGRNASGYGGKQWNISTDIIDAMVEGLNDARPRSSGRLRTVEDAIHSIEKRSSGRTSSGRDKGKSRDRDWEAGRVSSDDERDDKPSSFRYRDVRKGETAGGSSSAPVIQGSNPTFPPIPGRSFSKSSLLSPPSPSPPPGRTAKAENVKPKQTIMSIDEIIKLHSGAMNKAEMEVVDRAKLEIARASPNRSPTSPSTTTLTPLTPDSNDPAPPSHTETSPRTRRKSHARPTPPVPKRTSSSPGAKVAIIPTRTTSVSSTSDLARKALLDKLEEGSTRPTSPVSLAPSSARRVSFHPHTPTPTPRPQVSPAPSHRISKSVSLPPTPLLSNPNPAIESDTNTLARYLHSPHLNTILHLPRPYPERPLRVSLAQVGSPTGHPVLIFLGLGCVRYLIALYDDLARAYNLRLICIDRWGFGKTDEVPIERRGPVEWAQVVEKVLEELGLKGKFGVMAHSAGAAYASAVVLRMRERVCGRLCFLAPWVNVEVDGGYKWLKWVPNGVIKSAVAADWHLQSYILGKPLSPNTESESTVERTDSPNQLTPDKNLTPNSKTTSKLVRRASQVFGTRFEPPSNALSSSSTSSLTAAGTTQTQIGRSPRIRNLKSITSVRSQSDNSLPTLSNLNTPSTSSASMQLLTPHSKLDLPTSEDEFNFISNEGFSLTPQTLSTLPHLSSPSPAQSPSPDKPPLGPDLTDALTRSSHHESEPGTTSDLLRIILNRPYRPFGFSYTDLKGKVDGVDVWWGEEDDRVGEKGMRWLEDGSVLGARLRVVKGEGHGLMTCSGVLVEVFECLKKGVMGEEIRG